MTDFLKRWVMWMGLVTASMFGVYVAFLSLAPMRLWVHYKGVEVVQTAPDQPEIVVVHRDVRPWVGFIPVRRYTEIHDGGITRCAAMAETIAERLTGNAARFELGEYMGPNCDLTVMEGRRVTLQVTYLIQLPFSIEKRKTFETVGPFMVTHGNFVAAEMRRRARVPALAVAGP